MSSNYSVLHSTINGCPLGADDAFGPVVDEACRQHFDFTLMFEQSILSIGPSSVLLLIMPFGLHSLYCSDIKILSRHYLWLTKVAATSLLAGLQLALLMLWAQSSNIQTAASVPAAALSFIGTLAIYPLSYMEQTRSVRPSALLEVYLLVSLVLDIPQARTLFLRRDEVAIAAVFTGSIFAKLMLWTLEVQAKTKHLKYPYKGYPPEATHGIWNRTFFWWLNPLFMKGFKKLLSIEDLYQTDHSLSSALLQERIESSWERRSKPETRSSLIWACTKCFRWQLVSVVPPRLCLIGFNYAQPFLIGRLISFVNESTSSQSYNQSLGLITATALIYMGVAISTVHYKHQLFRSITMLRGALVALIFSKTMVLQDGEYDESAALTHMSTDMDRIAQSMESMPETWARILEVAIGIWLLSVKLGAVSVVPIIVVIVCGAANTRASKYTSDKQKIWNAAVQTRIASTASMLGSMKSVKMMGLADFMSRSIQDQRLKELSLAKGYRWIILITQSIGSTPAILAPVLTFIAYAIQVSVRGSKGLDVNQALTSLSIITLLTQPASTLLTAIPETAACIGSFERIQNYLLASSRKDSRGKMEKFESSAGADYSSLNAAMDIELRPLRAGQKIQTTPEGSTRKGERSASPAIVVNNASIQPSPSSNPALTDIDLQIMRSTINIVTGPVGSGKSTLVKALLGELPLLCGSISVHSTDIAYCAQAPWIINMSIRQNICGFEPSSVVDEEWYETVLHACALDEDLAQLADGGQSVPGSRGMTLSGGQKQRLALARAIYARREVILLDDVLSALDGKTEKLVVSRLIGPQGLLRSLRTTVVLITHSIQHFHLADSIVVLSKEGKIAQQGTLDQLQKQDGYINSLHIETTLNSEEIQAKPTPAPKRPKVKGVTNNDITDLTRKTGDLAVYKYYFKSVSILGLLCFLACTVLFVFGSYFPQYWLVWWAEAGGHQVGKYISVYVVLAVGAWFCRAGLLWWALIWISPRSSAKLHYTLLQTAVRTSLSFYAETDTGVTLNRFSQDIGLVDRILPLNVARVVLTIFMILAQGALIAHGSSFMAITIPFCIVAIYLLQKFYLLTSRQLRFLDLEARSPLYTHLLECLEGLSTIRAFGWQQAAQDIQIRCLDISQRPYYLLFCIQRWLALVLDIMVALLAVVVVALAVRLPNFSSGAAIGIALNNVLGFNQSLRVLVTNWTQLETSLGAIARLKNFEATIVPEDRPEECHVPPETWPDRGAVEFRGVTASYGGSPTPALDSISITVQPGQKLGICGRTGSGKSTLLLSLLRLLDLQRGTIKIDSIDLSTLPRSLIRQRMVAIPQDPFFISNASVRVNADPSSTATDASIIAILTKVGLWDTVFSTSSSICSSNAGVNPLGVPISTYPLSAGQKQLFSLARAIIRHKHNRQKLRCSILVLDEATSNVDVETDRRVQRVLREEFEGCTVIAVAHRVETIADADLIIRMKRGVIVEVNGKGLE